MPDNHARPVGSSSLMGASPGLTRCVVHAQRVGHGARGSAVRLAVPGRVPAGEHAADRLARPWRPEGPAVGPMPSLQARRSIRRRPHRSCTLSGNACGPPRVREGSTRAHPARTTVPPSPPKALAVAHGETMVRRAVVDGGRLLPRLACPPPEVPTRGQHAHISAAHPWHGGASSPRLATFLSWCANDFPRVSRPRTRWHGACSSPRACCTGAQCCPLRSREHCRTLGTIEGARLATAYGPGEAKQKGPIMPALVPHRPHQASGEHRDRVLPDFGDVQDNAMALAIAFDALASGERSWGCDVLRRLRHHICTTREVQSVQWVLQQVDTALRACAGQQPAAQRCRARAHRRARQSAEQEAYIVEGGSDLGDLLSLTRNFSAFGVSHRWHTYARVGLDEAPLFSRDWP